MRPSLKLVEKVRSMLFQPVLVPFRVIALAIAAMLLPVSEANAFRIIHVQDAAATVKSSAVKYIYPKNFQRSAPVNSAVARETRTVIVNNVATSYSPRINVNVDVYRRPAWYWNRNGGIRIHRAAVFPRSGPRLHRAGTFGF